MLHWNLILHKFCKRDGGEMIKAGWLKEELTFDQTDAVTVNGAVLVPAVQDSLRWQITINVQVLLT